MYAFRQYKKLGRVLACGTKTPGLTPHFIRPITCFSRENGIQSIDKPQYRTTDTPLQRAPFNAASDPLDVRRTPYCVAMCRVPLTCCQYRALVEEVLDRRLSHPQLIRNGSLPHHQSPQRGPDVRMAHSLVAVDISIRRRTCLEFLKGEKR